MNNCQCIKGHYNFSITVGDDQNLIYIDTSDWMDGENYSIPDTYTLTITLPGGSKKMTEVSVGAGDVISTSELQISKFIDGLYCFETFSCGKTYKRVSLVLPFLECCLRRARITLRLI